LIFIKKVIEGGVEMGTSTGDIPQESEQNAERPESGPGELVVTAENETNEGAENTASALQNGKFIFTLRI
jgi:hypothetical protein